MRVARFFALPTILVSLAIAPAVQAQDLDKQAWNLVWDRFEKLLPSGNSTNIVHALEVPLLATWEDTNDDHALLDLQHIAGAIPEENYVIDPSRMKRTLQDTYAEIVLAVDIPNQTPAQEQAFLAAQDRFDAARSDFDARLEKWDELWEKRKTALKAVGKPADSLARQDFSNEHPGFFNSVRAKMRAASSAVQKAAPKYQVYLV